VLVVMRTRWRLHLLQRGIRSVLAQTYPWWFLQIVNDGGPAHLVEADVDPYRQLLAGRLGVLHHERQRGMEAASNAGIAAGPGDTIAIHDDDDSWSPEFLERMLAWIDETGHDAAVSRSRLVCEAWNGRCYVRREAAEFGPALGAITAADVAERNLFPPIAFLFRRRVYDEVGPFHEGLPALGDWHFNRRVAARRTIGVVPETLAHWHIRAPDDQAPNSSRLDHARMERFVRAWPEPARLPPLFSPARQVRLWVDDGCLAGFERCSPTGPLATGLYLARFPADAVADGATAKFHVGTSTSLADADVVPLTIDGTGQVVMLFNARKPVSCLGLGPDGGHPQPLPAAAEVVRLGDELDALDDFAGPPRLPDVLCIGAQRAGTTWLHASLERHPQVWAHGIKEFHQFDWDGAEPAVGAFRQAQAIEIIRRAVGPDRDRIVRRALKHGFPPAHSWENYAAVFEGVPRERLVCDFTPAYAMLDDRAVADIVHVMPGVKVIFLIRDPVSRAISGGLHHLQRHGVGEPTKEALREACFLPTNELRTDFVRTLDIWQRHLPADRMLVLFHDDLARDPDGVIARTCLFLGLDPRALSGAAGAELPRNTGTTRVAWPALARVKAELSRRWLPMLVELERRFGEPAGQWRRAAEARVRAAEQALGGARSGLATTVDNNLAQWDLRDAWSQDGDEWDGQARACGVPYEAWKAGVVARYRSLLASGGTVLELGPGHGRWSDELISMAGTLVLCDISPNCLDACRHRLAGRGRMRTHLSAAADLPADLTAAVDAVWSYDCLVHVGPEEFRRYVAEIGRVLRRGGSAVLHHADRPRPGLAAHASRLVASLWLRGRPRVAPDEDDHGWRSHVSRRDVRGWAAAAGLVVERQESTWTWHAPHGPCTIGVPRFGDCITVLRRP
jgi:SAM-dependent methyltransferase